MIEEMYRILKGSNGDPGLLEKVRDNEERIKYILKRPAILKNWGMAILAAAMTILNILKYAGII